MAAASAGSLSGIGTLYAWEFDDENGTNFSITGSSTAYASEFDENTSTTLTSTQRMRVTSSPTGNVIVYDSINEIDPFGEIPTDGLQLHLDSVDSNVTAEGFAQGQQTFTSSGTFTVPTGVTQVSAVVVGGGGGGGDSTNNDEPGAGGGGGGLAYGTFTVTAGETLTVTVGNGGGNNNDGGSTSISRGGTTLLSGGGGGRGTSSDGGSSGGGNGGSSGGTERDGGGTGGDGGSTSDSTTGAGSGGGAGGYTDGTSGGDGANRGQSTGSAGSGGGGGGGGDSNASHGGSGGGGVGITPTSLTSGSGGTTSSAATGGSGGSDGSTTTSNTGGAGGDYGGGGGGGRNDANGGSGGDGVARIIWSTTTSRSYPTTLTTDQTSSSITYIWEDLTSNNRDATFIGNPTVVGNFINFDGTDDYAATDGTGTGSSSYLGIDGTGARTSIVFFKLDSNTITDQNRLLAWGVPGTTGGKWAIELNTSNQINMGVSGGSRQTNTTYDFSQWTMIATTYPGGTGNTTDIRIWVNGIEQTDLGGTTQTVNTDTTDSTGYVSIAAAVLPSTPNGFVDGQFAKVLIYNRELSDLEIKIIYRSILYRLPWIAAAAYVSVAAFNFRYHAFGSDTGDTTFYWYNTTTSTLNTLTTISGQQHTSNTDEWDAYSLDLSSYAGETGKIVIRYSTGGGFNQDPALDEMELVDTTSGTINLDPSNTQPNGGWEQQGGTNATYPTTGYSALTSNQESPGDYWQYDTNGTPSGNSGPDQDFNNNGATTPDGYYIYFEGSSPNNQTGIYGWLQTSSTYTLAG